jgi:hypothetical protein
MHEKQRDERSLDSNNDDATVTAAAIGKCHRNADRDDRQHHQGGENAHVGLDRFLDVVSRMRVHQSSTKE